MKSAHHLKIDTHLLQKTLDHTQYFKHTFSNSGIIKVAMVKNALLSMSLQLRHGDNHGEIRHLKRRKKYFSVE